MWIPSFAGSAHQWGLRATTEMAFRAFLDFYSVFSSQPPKFNIFNEELDVRHIGYMGIY